MTDAERWCSLICVSDGYHPPNSSPGILVFGLAVAVAVLLALLTFLFVSGALIRGD